MTAALRFDPIRLPPECEQLRKEVRAFLADEIAAGTFDPHLPNREDTDAPEFSRRVGERGWLGMTWPKKYGGHERSFLERYVVTEEMRVANAPTRRFFVADRQSGPVLLKYAPEHIKMDILPRICRGEICFAIGMSEPNSGSDLFAAKTKATKTDGGFLINGTKIWTSSAHIADYMIAIFRTSPPTKENRRHGLTQFLVKMKQPGIQVNPIVQITGQYEFNEVVFDDDFVPDDHVLGEIDGAWKQATSELAYERCGPERFLETYYVLTELVRAVGDNPDTRSAEGIGRLVAQLHTMRRMSVSVAGMLQAGKEPVVEASIVKDIGTIWEQQLPHRVRDLAAFVEENATNRETLEKQLVVRDQDRAEADHPGRHHRSAARHHRARARPALSAQLRCPIQRGNTMSKFTDIGVEKHGHVGLIEIQRPPLNFFDISLINQIADALEEFDKDIEIRAVGSRRPGQGVLRRRQFQRSEAAGTGGGRGSRFQKGRSRRQSRLDQQSLSARGAHLPRQEADRRRRAGRRHRRRPRPCGLGGLPRHLPRGALRRQLHQARLPSGLRADRDAARTGRQEQRRADLLHQPPRHRRGSHQNGPRQSLRAAGPGPRRSDEARRRKSPSARRSACSRPAPPCAPASPTACWPRPTTNSPNNPACAPPKTSRKASRPPPSAAWRISRGGRSYAVIPGHREAMDPESEQLSKRDSGFALTRAPECRRSRCSPATSSAPPAHRRS